jgi:iron complex outermembrane recepter protein
MKRRNLGGPARIVFFACVLLATQAIAAELDVRDLGSLTLEQLANIEVTSVSKRPERLADAPASLFVITAEDIRRSGATSLPDVLRLAPNLQVTQVHASAHAISSRGFNSSSANKLLVLIDGRSVYSPLFSGVFWDAQDVVLEDIDRIEVISGPAGTLWGTNAVNGVINIISRTASQTHGNLVAAGGGDLQSGITLRHGAAAGNGVDYRIYAKYLDRTHTETANGAPKDDDANRAQAGFRADWQRGDHNFTVHGNAYRGASGQARPGSISTGAVFALGPITTSGGNVLARWNTRLGDGGTVSVQAYYDRTSRTVTPTFSEELDIGDVQFQHTLAATGNHNVAWGAEYRHAADHVVNSQYIAFLPARVNLRWLSAFVQDEIVLGERWRATLGARLERNDYTGGEFLPSARLAWKPAPDHLLWTAVSRTVRAPSRLDRDVFVPGAPPFVLDGGSEVVSEVAKVYEFGYRGHLAARFNASATIFHADYDHLRTQELAPSGRSVFFASRMHGNTTGIELWGTWQAADRWRLSAGYSGLRKRLKLNEDSRDAAAQRTEGVDPAHVWVVRSAHDLGTAGELDITARGVAALSNPDVPRYAVADLRYAFKPAPGLEVWVAARNLGSGGHGEFSAIGTRTEVERSFHIGARWNFGGH